MPTQAEILAIVEEMQAYAGTPEERRALFGDKYPVFAEKYPGLFYKSSEDGMDMKMLGFMLQNLGSASGEEKVGQELFEKYVSPAFADRFKGKF
jgi:hypothetical protein